MSDAGFFHSAPAAARLAASARDWLGTKWCMGSAIKGGGVDCIRLCLAIYQETGFLPASFTIPLRGYGHRHVEAAIAFLSGSEHFAPVTGWPKAGDLLLMAGDRLHFGLCLWDGASADWSAREMVQCMRQVTLHSLHDHTVAKTRRGLFRPLA